MANKNKINKHTKLLPRGWMWIKFENIAGINPRFDKEGITQDIEVTFLPMRCVEELTGKIDLSITKKLSKVIKGYTPFKDGDLLFAKITPCMENGKIAIAENLHNGLGFGSTEFHVIRLPEIFPKKLFFYYMIQDEFRKEAKRAMKGTAGQLRVPTNYLRHLKIPLPPLPEQHRIVAKIEELFAKLDAGVEALKKIKKQIKQYRQAVLKFAFEGKLTEEWRRENKDKLEAVSILLEKIKKERKKQQGKKYKELPPVDTPAFPSGRSKLPNLPEGWVWTNIVGIGEVVTGTTPSKSKREYYGKDFPFYKPTDLNDGYYVTKSQDNLSKKGIEKARLLPPNSVLVTCIGTIGKTGFIRVAGASNQQINAIVPQKSVLPEYVYFICISPQFQKSIIDNASATTLPILNKSKFENLTIPLPPLPEQHKIVEKIEKRFAMADEIEKVVEQSLKQAERLHQSILKRAFEGKLVTQNPLEPPASELLKRIKAEKERLKREKKVGKKRKKKGRKGV